VNARANSEIVRVTRSAASCCTKCAAGSTTNRGLNDNHTTETATTSGRRKRPHPTSTSLPPLRDREP